jgi:hypothetical protein
MQSSGEYSKAQVSKPKKNANPGPQRAKVMQVVFTITLFHNVSRFSKLI